MPAIRFTNLTRQIEIGANCYLIETNNKRVVLDCGGHPKLEGRDSLPLLHLVKEHLQDHPLDAIILTHAHQDHLGSLPVLMRQYPATPVYMTEPTRQLACVMLHNSVNVMMKRKEQGQPDYPLFTHREVTACEKRFFPLPLHQRFSLTGDRIRPNDTCDFSIQFEDAGHILGSAAVLIATEGKRILYTGDVNFCDQSLMIGAKLDLPNIDTVIIETTRGSIPEPENFDRKQEELRFIQAISEVFAQGGSVLIPVFALGKTQEVLTTIHQFRKRGLFPECPVYIGGLSTKLTDIYDRLSSASFRQHTNLDILESVAPITISGREVNQYPVRPGRIYALSSGMMTEHTLSNVIANQFIPNPAHGIFFVGYADPDSPAGRLRSAAKGDSIMVNPTAPPETLRCRVETFAFSAHGSREQFVGYLQKLNAANVILVHGDPEAITWFQETLSPKLPQTRLLSAPSAQTIEL